MVLLFLNLVFVPIAEKLHRKWVKIDITHLAINVIKKILRDRYTDVKFEVIGEPEDLEGARELAKLKDTSSSGGPVP